MRFENKYKELMEAAANLPPPTQPPAVVFQMPQYRTQFQVTDDFVNYIARVENGIKKGLVNNKWYPHKSVEGGTDTIAYGHKLQPGEDFRMGLTQQQAMELLKKDIQVAVNRAQTIVNKVYGQGSWEKLDNTKKEMLVDFAFNGVLSKFPKFLEGVVLNLPNQMKAQYKRYANGKEMTDRNSQFANRYLQVLP